MQQISLGGLIKFLKRLCDDVVDTVYDNAQGSYRLPINNAVSLAWIDSEFSFKAIFPGGDIPLASAIVKSVLSGLTYLQPSP